MHGGDAAAGLRAHRPLGVAGAGLASSPSVAAGVAALAVYFARLEKYVGFDAAQARPRFATWARMLDIGLPAGGEFALIGVFAAVLYWIIRDFGAAAQAGFGIGARVMQSLFVRACGCCAGSSGRASGAPRSWSREFRPRDGGHRRVANPKEPTWPNTARRRRAR